MAVDKASLAVRIRRFQSIGLLVNWLLVSFALVSGLFAYYTTDQAYSRILAEMNSLQDRVNNLTSALTTEILHTRAFLITGDTVLLTQSNFAREEFRAEALALAGLDLSHIPAAGAALARLIALHAQYEAVADQVTALRQAGQVAEAVRLFDAKSVPLVSEILSKHAAVRDAVQTSLILANLTYSQQTRQAIVLVIVAFAAGTIVGSWLQFRLPSKTLDSLDFLERILIQAVREDREVPAKLPPSVTDGTSPIFSAYNALVQRLDESHDLRLDFLARVSHEMRSPLASIMGYAATLADMSPELPADARAKYLRTIVRQAVRMSRLVEDVLAAAKVDEDRLDMLFQPVRLGALVSEVVDDMLELRTREIAVENRLETDTVMGDALRLREVFGNLLDNAAKFSSPDTAINVALRPSAMHPRHVEVAVKDQGIGIAEADLPQLFRRFGRINSPQTRGISGSGLGLYVVKSIVDRHQGFIDVQSAVGRGTTFCVSLPLALPE